MRFCNLIGLAMLSVALTGCPEYDHYELQLRPDGKALERELTCWRERSQNGGTIARPFSASLLAAIEKAYDEKPTEARPLRYRFKGRFADHTPQDIGGSGSYIVVESPLGDIRAYVERFRGNDDLVGQLDAIFQATNRLTNLVLGWFESQMRDDASWSKVRNFLDGEFRRDVHNLALYLWLGRANASDLERSEKAVAGDGELPEAFTSSLARLPQYLIEHGYLDTHEGLDIGRELALAKPETDEEMMRHWASYAQEILAKKCDLEPLQGMASLDFLLDVEKVAESFSSFVKQTPEYEQLRRDRLAKQEKPPEAGDVLANIIVEDILHLHLFEHADELDLSLATSEKPLATNGQWDQAAERIKWRRSINADDGLPTLCFAAWCQPDVAFQEQHFGHVFLRGNELARYVAAYAMLDPDARTELDQFIEKLEKGGDVKTKIYGFAFQHRQTNPPLAEIGKILADAIEKVK